MSSYVAKLYQSLPENARLFLQEHRVGEPAWARDWGNWPWDTIPRTIQGTARRWPRPVRLCDPLGSFRRGNLRPALMSSGVPHAHSGIGNMASGTADNRPLSCGSGSRGLSVCRPRMAGGRQSQFPAPHAHSRCGAGVGQDQTALRQSHKLSVCDRPARRLPGLDLAQASPPEPGTTISHDCHRTAANRHVL